ncbi:MAG: phospholipase D family protein, partial [Verrucomicrobiae bacterium]|nr:phospholipase D family protein [Verrucomicrobiae bacterium]
MRSIYTAALAPPPGMVFDEAIGTTFSLDPVTLLSVPIHLAMPGGDRADPIKDGIVFLEATRRLANRITVYAQRGRLQVPRLPHVLYSVLESMVVEVNVPGGGVFHPKLWVLRFVDPDDRESVLMRLMVLSRNLTADRSWDSALTLEGEPTKRSRADNRPLGEFITGLPEMAHGDLASARIEQARRLGDEIRRVEWETPPGFDRVKFHVLGDGRMTWRPEPSTRLAVISPFCTDRALEMLVGTTRQPDVLISRPETFDKLAASTIGSFGQCRVLEDAAETEDGEDQDEDTDLDTLGLHAKVYIFERGWDTHVVLGSANATNAALIAGANVEVLAELVGRRSRLGGTRTLLEPEGLGEVLTEYRPSDGPEDVDEDQMAAEEALEKARALLLNASLRLACAPGTRDEEWCLDLRGALP